MIELLAAKKAFKENLVFEDASVQLHLGTYYTLTGPNGSGKSTLMKCLLQQEELTEGQMLLNGVQVKSSSRPFRTQVFGINDAIGWLPGGDRGPAPRNDGAGCHRNCQRPGC